MHEIKETIEVISIADDLKILNIFRLRSWKVNEGIDFLVGIFEENHLPDGSIDFVMLDGRHYLYAQHKSEIDALNLRSKLLVEIWESTGRRRERYPPRILLEWGMKYRDLSKISWYDDALTKGLLTEILKPDELQEAAKQEQSLNAKEKGSLLKIIAGFTKLYYGDLRRGLKAEIFDEFQNLVSKNPELKIDKDTLRISLDAAWKKYLPNESDKNVGGGELP